MIIAKQVFALPGRSWQRCCSPEAPRLRPSELSLSATAILLASELARQEAFPARLEAMLRMNGTDAQV
jgi:hypothetical protein